MSIEEIIYKNALAFPEKIAVISGEVRVSYSDLWNRIRQSVAFFTSNPKIKKGDRVILSASKSIDFVYNYFGAHLAGLICVPIDPETNATRLARIVDSAKPALIIGELRNRGDYQVLPFEDVLMGKDVSITFPKDEEIADLLFTTGTTGLPKGVELSYKNQVSAAENINTFVGNNSGDVELLALPISHSFGLGRLRCVLSKGETLVMLGSFASMKKFFGEMERCKVTGFGMVPASWSYILKMSGEKIGQFASQLKYIEIGSAFMSKENKEKLMSLLPHTRICMHYGLTEASRSTFISFHEDKDYLDSVGKPSPHTFVKIFDEKGNEKPNGEQGEICVKGNHVCSGYWDLPLSSFHEDFYKDYFKTGDWGYKDDKGFIYMISRKKEIINVGGKKVSPIEVEEALDTIEGIEESACISVPDDVLGEVVKAFIVGRLTADDDESIKKKMSGMVENYKVPAFIEHIAVIPKTSSGKIQRLLLK